MTNIIKQKITGQRKTIGEVIDGILKVQIDKVSKNFRITNIVIKMDESVVHANTVYYEIKLEGKEREDNE